MLANVTYNPSNTSYESTPGFQLMLALIMQDSIRCGLKLIRLPFLRLALRLELLGDNNPFAIPYARG